MYKSSTLQSVRMCPPCSKPHPPPNWRSRSRVFVTSYHVSVGSGTGAVYTHGPHIRMSVFYVHLVPLHHPVLSLYTLTRLYIHYVGVFTIMYTYVGPTCMHIEKALCDTFLTFHCRHDYYAISADIPLFSGTVYVYCIHAFTVYSIHFNPLLLFATHPPLLFLYLLPSSP